MKNEMKTSKGHLRNTFTLYDTFRNTADCETQCGLVANFCPLQRDGIATLPTAKYFARAIARRERGGRKGGREKRLR